MAAAEDPLAVPPGGALRMRWHELLFAHWPLPADVVRAALPKTDPPLELDLFDGQAWLGAVPFRMSGIAPRWLPALPGVSAFPEANLRTYATVGGRPGVWFFSLDAASWMAVRAARFAFHLPYFDAEMSCRERDGWIDYRSRRTHRGAAPAVLACRYRPTSEPFRATPGTFAHWATERYSLYAADRRGRLWRGDVAHAPWPLQHAEAEWSGNTLGEGFGMPLDGPPASLLFARELAIAAWLLRPADAPADAR